MKIEKIAFGGWANCLRIANDHAEIVVTLDVGPRVISYQHLPGGKNVLKTNAEELGKSGESEFVARGGHRIWLAPESERTYLGDNVPVIYELLPNGVRLENAPAAPWHIKKTLIVTLSEDSSQVTLEHRATNDGAAPAALATWGVTVMEPGGLEIIPRPPMGQHPRDLQPNRLQVLWPYTDTADERWRWGRQFITLRQTAHSSPTKLGLQHRMQWIGYLTRSILFVKLVEFEEGAAYPDFGCNFETFSNSQMLEIETLSPLRTVAPGESVGHTERWRLFDSIPEPQSLKEDALAEWIEPFLGKLGLR
jgi:hypothetical protein